MLSRVDDIADAADSTRAQCLSDDILQALRDPQPPENAVDGGWGKRHPCRCLVMLVDVAPEHVEGRAEELASLTAGVGVLVRAGAWM